MSVLIRGFHCKAGNWFLEKRSSWRIRSVLLLPANELNGRHAEVDPACGVDPEHVVEGPRAARSLDPLRPFIVGWKAHTTRVLKELKCSGGDPCRPDAHLVGFGRY